MNNERKECFFFWRVYNYCWHLNGEPLLSPEFTANTLAGTYWFLVFCPRGEGGYISLYLRRSDVDNGPEDFLLKFLLSVLGSSDGTPLVSKKYQKEFKKGAGYGYSDMIKIDEVISYEKKKNLFPHNLTVNCCMWVGDGNILQVERIVARTIIGIEQISFLHVVEDFSALEPNQKKTVQIRSASKKEKIALSSSLHFVDDPWCDGKLIVEITPSDSNKILSTCQLSLLDASAKRSIVCCEVDNRLGSSRKCIQKLPLSLTREVILSRKSEFLQDGKLSLMCECSFTTGIEYEKIEIVVHEITPAILNSITDNVPDKDVYNAAGKLSACLSVSDELKVIYSNQRLTDLELKTKTKSFPAHRLVLCARSSVFDAMLSNDMKEKFTNCIRIDDIVQKLLLFLYSDLLENLEWDSATKLYYAADKYNVFKLKVMCTSFLLDSISVSNASELLLLADTHSDSDLKTAVEDFIFKHDDQVFCSEKWEHFMESNPLLASKTMRLSYMKKS